MFVQVLEISCQVLQPIRNFLRWIFRFHPVLFYLHAVSRSWFVRVVSMRLRAAGLSRRFVTGSDDAAPGSPECVD